MTRSPRSILYGQHAAPGGVSPPVQCGAVIFKVAGPNTGLSWYNSAGPITPHGRGGHSQWIAKAIHSLIEPLRKAAAKALPYLPVAGVPEIHPQTEDDRGNVNPIGVRSCYDDGKRCAETLFFDCWRQHALDTKVAQIFNIYGPRMHHADGCVDDLISGFIALMDSNKSVTGPINMGNPGEFTIRELAEKTIAYFRGLFPELSELRYQ